jgi:hypothetical protein
MEEKTDIINLRVSYMFVYMLVYYIHISLLNTLVSFI